MDNAYAPSRRLLTIAALLSIAAPTLARPMLVPPQRLTVPPLVAEEYPGQYPSGYNRVAIDGDTLLVSAHRATKIDSTGVHGSEGTHLFQRSSDGTWRYVKALVETNETWYRTPLVSGDLATVQHYTQILVFERGTAGWTQTGTIAVKADARSAVRVEDGSIYMAPLRGANQTGCLAPFEQWRKVSGTWKVVATIGPQRCQGDEYLADVNGGRALITHVATDGSSASASDLYASNGTATWSRVATLPAARQPAQPTYVYVSRAGSLAGTNAFIGNPWRYRDSGGNNWVGPNTLAEPEYELRIFSGEPKLRGNSLFLAGGEEDYELPIKNDSVVNHWRTLRVYRARSDGNYDYFARLNIDYELRDWSVSDDGTRAAALSPDDNYSGAGSRRLYVFEIPATATFPGTQQDTFESGNYSKWTATLGQFSVASTSRSKVLRQQDITGDAKAFLTAIDWTDQSIEADIRPTEFGGTDRWFGLATRRTDDQNYYYVTYRQPSTVSLRRYENGVVNVLATATLREPLVAGRSYRVRLESVGDQHAVFIDGFPVAHAKDTRFKHGQPGVVSYRTRFDADNVTVSSGTRLLLRFDTYRRDWSNGYTGLPTGQWSTVTEPSDDVGEHGEYLSYVLRQGDTSGDVQWFSKVATGNQVISARVRPMTYGAVTGTNAPWVGLAAHVVDDRNYYYVTLRGSNEFSLRRMVNGQVQILGTVPQTVTRGTWYDLRLEIVGLNIRAYVNGDLRISATDSTLSGGGRNGMLMYKAAADWYHYIAYQP